MVNSVEAVKAPLPSQNEQSVKRILAKKQENKHLHCVGCCLLSLFL